MKTFTISLLCFILFFTAGKPALSQKTIHAVWHNGEITFEKHEHARYNQKNLIVIDSVNSLLHKTSIKIQQYGTFSDPPEMLSKLFPALVNDQTIQMNKTLDTVVNQPNVTLSFLSKIEVLDTLLTRVKQNLRKTSNDPIKNNLLCIDALTEINGYFNQKTVSELISHLKQKSDSIMTTYELLKIQNEHLQHVDRIFASEIAAMSYEYNQLKSMVPKVITGIKILAEGAKGPENIKLQKKYSFMPNNDLTVANVYVIDRFSPNDTLFKVQREFWSVGKWKLDFSAGLMTNTLNNPGYYFIYSNDSTKSDIGTEENTKLDFGVAALLHINYRISTNTAIGPVIGLGVSRFDELPRYLLGGSVTVGKMQTLSLSAGRAWGYLNKLSGQISDNGKNFNRGSITKLDVIPTTKSVQGGWFVSVTYNLSRKVKKSNPFKYQ